MRKVHSHTDSYMEFRAELPGEPVKWLRVPTFWDAYRRRWWGYIREPEPVGLITAYGKDSQELQDNFNIAIMERIDGYDDRTEAFFALFRPRSYWEGVADE